MESRADVRDVGLGLMAVGARVGVRAGRVLMLPVGAAARAPVIGGPIRETERRLAERGRELRTQSQGELESVVDVTLAGPLTEAVAVSLAQNRVVERVADQVLAATDLDRIVAAVLEDPRTEQMLETALTSPGLERLIVRVLESRLLDELTNRLIESPEMQRIVGHIASSPEVLAAVTTHTESLAEEMIIDVRRRSQRLDDVAERTARGLLRRPRTRER